MDCPKCVENGIERKYRAIRQSFEQGEWWCSVHGPYWCYPQHPPENRDITRRKQRVEDPRGPHLTDEEREWLRRTP